MSGLEALGALASAAQVTAYVVRIAVFLADVYENLKHSPERIRQHTHQVQRLIDIILHIKDNPSLHTKLIFAPLDSISAQAYSLQALLVQLLSQYTHFSFRRRYWTVLKGTKEKQVLVALQNREREKSHLILCLTTSQTEILHNVGRGAGMSESNTHTRVLPVSTIDLTFAQTKPSPAPEFFSGEQKETRIVRFRNRNMNDEPEIEEIKGSEDQGEDKPNVEQYHAGDDSEKGPFIIEEPVSFDESSQFNGLSTTESTRCSGGTTTIKKPQSQNKSLQINGLVLGGGISLAQLVGRNV